MHHTATSQSAASPASCHVAKEGAARRIRANVVVPGLVDTPMGRQASAARHSRTASFARIPLGRQGTAREMAEAVTFLLSDRASSITAPSSWWWTAA